MKHRVRERGVETWKKTKCEEVCVEENRDKGEINKVKGEENVVEKKTEEKKKCCVGYKCGVGQEHEQIFFFF